MRTVPASTRIYAVGDIHGQSRLLDGLLDRIDAHESESPPVDRRVLVFVGDYIDRGPDSKGVIDRLLALNGRDYAPVFLLGNHEQMALDVLDGKADGDLWLHNGGADTLRSYLVRPDDAHLAERFRRALPAEHLKFLRGLRLSWRCGGYFFVHAGVKAGVPLDQQNPNVMLWIRDSFLFDYSTDYGAVVVHGHTPTEDVEIVGNRIGVDTGAFYTGRLSAVCLDDRGVKVLEYNETCGR